MKENTDRKFIPSQVKLQIGQYYLKRDKCTLTEGWGENALSFTDSPEIWGRKLLKRQKRGN